jgi:hypothetical protein
LDSSIDGETMATTASSFLNPVAACVLRGTEERGGGLEIAAPWPPRESFEAHQKEREVMFANEGFLIGILQVVSAAAIFGAIAQQKEVIALAGKLPLLLFLTAMAMALICSVLAAYWRYWYKTWDIKMQASDDHDEALGRKISAGIALKSMRVSMLIATWAIVAGICEIVVAAWIVAYR